MPNSNTLIPITVVIPVKNEEANLPLCLSNLSRFSEVIVVDSSSTDSTSDITKQYGVKYINFVWDGKYPKKRNWVLLNQKLNNEWVLFLDADEFITHEFCEALQNSIQNSEKSGYWIDYSNYFLGKQLKYGVPQRKLALFRVDSGLYEYIEEDCWSELDMEIHEHPIIEGSVGRLQTTIEHNDFRGINKFISRHQQYAMWEARRTNLLTASKQNQLENMTSRQIFKYRNISKWWFPVFYFNYTYLVKFGFLDGRAGFLYALYKFWYFTTIRIMISELKHNDKNNLW